jgi:hypothetical protein
MSSDVLELPDPPGRRSVGIMMPGTEAMPRDGMADEATDGAAGKGTPDENAEKPAVDTVSAESAISEGCPFNDDDRLNLARGIARAIVLSVPAWALIAWALYLML